VLDWIGALAVPVILVCGSYLGALSHALTSLEVLRQRRISVHAIVVNETPDATVTVAETVESLAGFADPVPVISVAHQIGDSLDSNIGRLAALLY
jgi:dethiobiotin synthetase